MLAFKFVTADPLPERLPEKVPAVIVPAEKFLATSRLTIVEVPFKFVALFAAVAPEATFAAETLLTLFTTAAAVPGPVAETSPVRAVRSFPADCLPARAVSTYSFVAAPSDAEGSPASVSIPPLSNFASTEPE